MLSDKRSVPQKGGKYLNASLPEYEDVTPVVKIGADAFCCCGRSFGGAMLPAKSNDVGRHAHW